MFAGVFAMLAGFQVGCGGGGGMPQQTAAGQQGTAAAPTTAAAAANNTALGGNQMFSAAPTGATGTGTPGAPGSTGTTGATGATVNTSTTGASGATSPAAAPTTAVASTSNGTAAGTPTAATGTTAPPPGNSFALTTSNLGGATIPTAQPPGTAGSSTPSTGTSGTPSTGSSSTPSSSTPSQPSNQLASASKPPSQPSGGLGSPSEKKQPPPPPNPLRDRGSGPGCFTAGTLVMTPRGLVAIENLVAGEPVMAPARDAVRTVASAADAAAPAPEVIEARSIVRTTRLPNDHLRVLQLRDASGNLSRIETTEGHPFWVEGKGWTRAMDLTVGQLCSRGNSYAVVESTVLEEHPEGVWVYNLEVEGTRTYQVGPMGIVVQGW